jgi:hypothetical protein
MWESAAGLKGALLFELWTEQTRRPTRDAAFLSQGENSLERFQKIFQEICALRVEDDALRFDAHLLRVERIKQDQDYEGMRETFLGSLKTRVFRSKLISASGTQ